MPLEISILEKMDLMFMRSHGLVTDADSIAAFETYATHPAARPGQNMLNDMSGFEESRIDYQKRMALHSIMEPILTMGGMGRTYVMYVPNGRSAQLAQNYLRFWEAVPLIDVHLTASESEALRILKLPYTSFAEMIAAEKD